MFHEYKMARGTVALSKEELLLIDAETSNQVCDVFGIHPSLPVVQELYGQGDALFVAGVGVLSEPVTKENYVSKTKTQLFAHNTSK